jgi:small-conductance mechanosensitive channel
MAEDLATTLVDWLVGAAWAVVDAGREWAVTNLPDIVAAVVVVLLGYRLSKTATKYAGRPVYQWVNRESIARTVLRLIRYLIIIASLLIAGRIAFDLSLASFLLTATVFSAVVGIVLAPLVGDLINGVFVLGDQPYEIGDMIELVDTGQQGFVEDVTIRYTKIFTLDNTFLVIPNSEIRKRDVDNYSAEDIRTRQTIDVTVTYESDVDEARRLLEEAAAEQPEVISTEGTIRIGSAEYPMQPRTMITEFGDHGVALRLRYWLREPYHLRVVRSAINTAVWQKFRDHDVRIPYPHVHHVYDDTSGVGEFEVYEGGEDVATRRRDGGRDDDGAGDPS